MCLSISSFVLFAAFSEGLVDEGGYSDVVNVDISSVVIEAMQNKYKDRPQLKCILVMDSCYKCHCFHFDVVIMEP